MSLYAFIKEASERGEKIKSKFFEQVVNSQWLNELLKNESIVNGMVAVLNAKNEVEESVQRNMSHVLKYFKIPTEEVVQGMERKIHQLENEIEDIHRRIVTEKLKKKAAPKKQAGNGHAIPKKRS